MRTRITVQIFAVLLAAGGATAAILTGLLEVAGEKREPLTLPVQVQSENGPSLGGMAAEFFAMPADRSERLQACRSSETPDPDCARETAEQFCRGAGYSYVGNLAMETVGGRVFLADVLCKRSAVAITW